MKKLTMDEVKELLEKSLNKFNEHNAEKGTNIKYVLVSIKTNKYTDFYECEIKTICYNNFTETCVFTTSDSGAFISVSGDITYVLFKALEEYNTAAFRKAFEI